MNTVLSACLERRCGTQWAYPRPLYKAAAYSEFAIKTQFRHQLWIDELGEDELKVYKRSNLSFSLSPTILDSSSRQQSELELV